MLGRIFSNAPLQQLDQPDESMRAAADELTLMTRADIDLIEDCELKHILIQSVDELHRAEPDLGFVEQHEQYMQMIGQIKTQPGF